MDISPFEVISESVPCPIVHPETGEKTDIVIFIQSTESIEFKKRIMEEARKDMQAGKKLDDSEVALRALKLVSRVITGWEGIEKGGKAWPYSQKNAIALVEGFPWIAAQIEEFSAKRQNFFVGSAKK